MDYRIRRNPKELDSTGYMEIGPGRYAGQHWQNGFLFVWEDAFSIAEGLIMLHYPSYDHMDMNDLPRDVGSKVITAWRDVADRLGTMSAVEAQQALHLGNGNSNSLERELAVERNEIISFLRELAEACEGFYEENDWICILGM